MTLRGIRDQSSKAMKDNWPVLAVGLIGLTAGLLQWLLKSDVLTTGVLAATLAAATWYSLETRALRMEQRASDEIRYHPWLRGSDLKVTWLEDQGGAAGLDELYLPITNIGQTPAHDLTYAVGWRRTGRDPLAESRNVVHGDLSPGDTLHAKLCAIPWENPDDGAAVEVSIDYRTYLGGRGRLSMKFERDENGWTNRDCDYEFRLASGPDYPVPVRWGDRVW
jgi:hypothetical protein